MSLQRIAITRLHELQTGDRIVEGMHTPDAEGLWVEREVPEPLPVVPGYYVAENPDYGSTVVVELLGVDGQWVDAGDRHYLVDREVQAMGKLVRLAPVAEVLRRVQSETEPDPVLDLIAREYGVTL